jgi:hypothetical protein
VHSDRLGGPVWVFLMIVIVLTIALAVFVIVDGIRRLRRCGADERPWLVFYVALEVLYLLMLGIAQLSVLPRIFAAFVALATPFALILSFVYLLRVVFPKRPERTPACESGVDEVDVPPPPTAV